MFGFFWEHGVLVRAAVALGGGVAAGFIHVERAVGGLVRVRVHRLVGEEQRPGLGVSWRKFNLPGRDQVPGCKMRGAMLEPIHPVQVEGFRRMTPAQKLQMVADLYEAGIRLKMAGLRPAHPDWTEQQLEREARRSLLYAGT